MTRAMRLAMVASVGIIAAVSSRLLGGSSPFFDLTILATGIAAGELVILHPAQRAPLPLSFAVFTVLARAATPGQIILVVVAAEAVASIFRIGPIGLGDRAFRFLERCAEAFTASAAYQIMIVLFSSRETMGPVLAALAAGSIAPIVVADAVNAIRGHQIASLRARGADVALITSGILMTIGYEGIEGKGELGLWGPVLFSIPLVAAWYSFELLASTRRSFDQTIRALAAAPELGGLVRPGHADRVAELAREMGAELGLPPNDLEHLETAARLHHLGVVCLDEPAPGESLDPLEVAAAGAAMLRASEVLAPAGDIVAAEPLLHRPPGSQDPPAAALSGMILKVASAYDELTEGDDAHAGWAVEALYTGPGYVYDGRVLDALERVLVRRGVLRTA